MVEYATEAQWQKLITDYADAHGWLWYHVTDSRKDKAGFPDLVLVRERVIFAELKRSGGRTTTDQDTWLSALRATDQVEVYLWHASEETWAEVEATLA
jgi:hypothetical protein